jgi:hypothetical protein
MIEQVVQNKSSLLVKNILQDTQKLQFFTKQTLFLKDINNAKM